jgi:hypothetical protein
MYPEQPRSVPGEKIGGRIDPDLTNLKHKFEDEYWQLLQKKIKETKLGVEELLFKDRGGFLRRSCQDCITNCVDCVTGCNASCIVAAPL